MEFSAQIVSLSKHTSRTNEIIPGIFVTALLLWYYRMCSWDSITVTFPKTICYICDCSLQTTFSCIFIFICIKYWSIPWKWWRVISSSNFKLPSVCYSCEEKVNKMLYVIFSKGMSWYGVWRVIWCVMVFPGYVITVWCTLQCNVRSLMHLVCNFIGFNFNCVFLMYVSFVMKYTIWPLAKMLF